MNEEFWAGSHPDNGAEPERAAWTQQGGRADSGSRTRSQWGSGPHTAEAQAERGEGKQP